MKIMNNFHELYEAVTLENFDQSVKDKPQFKKAVKVGNAPKKAVLISKAPPKEVKPRTKGLKFTPKKPRSHGRMIHFTNMKNSFKRSQKRKSRKGHKK